MFDRCSIKYLTSHREGGYLSKFLVALYAYIQAVWYLTFFRVDIVHVHMATGTSFWRKAIFCWLAQIFRVRYACHIHSGMFPKWVNIDCSIKLRSIIKSVLRNSSVTIALTKEWGIWLAEFAPGTTIETLGNPVTVRTAKKELTPWPTVLFLGRLSKVKGVNELLSAFKIVIQQYPSARLILCGEGDLAAVKDLVVRLGIAENVEYPGWVSGSAKHQLMSSVWVYALPSHFEGLPMGLLEAMSYGIASVASRIGGIPDLVEDGKDGLLIHVFDVEALSVALIKLIESTTLRETIGLAAREKVIMKYSCATIESELVAIYCRVGLEI